MKHLDKPVFNTVADAVEKEGADTSVIFVPPVLQLMPLWKQLMQESK
jgi:succinyl-CoA synthetase alpha subunit